MAPPKKLVQKVTEDLSDCQKLIYWKDINKSATYFMAPLIVTYVLQNYTVLGLLSYTLMMACLLSSLFVAFKQVLNAMQMQKNPNIKPEHPFQLWIDELPKKLHLNDECVAKFSQNLTLCVNCAATGLVKLVLVDSFSKSGSFLVFLYVFRCVFAKFTMVCLFQMIWISAFSLPMIYKFKQTEIDGILLKVWTPVKPHYEKLCALLEKFQNAQEAKDE